ncbi:unnamed protein product [Rhizoctonia solani]|uniref:Uncharacterized protein n=1 Tax=Rhizoctonia solani TaxID=456999 RepID=A0A8H3BZ56_9AGAM|nr:unnamed protein product [Rhizoctonia solani]CAE7211985.1 unnamed protein product [Rhizoctonia solani]
MNSKGIEVPDPDPTRHAYIIVTPDPNHSLGAVLKHKSEDYTIYRFEVKIGDSRDALDRIKAYRKKNISQRIAIIKLKEKGKNGKEVLGKYLETNYFKEHEACGRMGGTSEWRRVYGDEGLSSTIEEALNRFIPIDESRIIDESKLQKITGLSWKELDETLKSVSNDTTGPTKKTKPTAPKYPMISISVTPNILQDESNNEFTVGGYSETGSPDTFIYVVTLKDHITRHNTVDGLVDDMSRSTAPNLGSNGYEVSERELERLGDACAGSSKRARLKELVFEGEEFLKRELKKYGLEANTDPDPNEPFIQIRGSTKNKGSEEGIQFLRTFILDFPKYHSVLCEAAYKRWASKLALK